MNALGLKGHHSQIDDKTPLLTSSQTVIQSKKDYENLKRNKMETMGEKVWGTVNMNVMVW